MPSNWKPPKVFFGWWIVGASLLIALYVGGVVFYGFTAIFEPIANEMGWSYTQISLAASLRGLEMGLLAPFSGILVDRWGPRRLIAGGAVIIAISFILLGYATSLGMFYAAYVLMAIGVSACTLTVLMTAIANWFRKKIGLASGIAVCGFGLSGLLIPVIVRLIEIYQWRMTVTFLALGMLVMVLPLSLLFRHRPEHYSYLPDDRTEDSVTYDNSPAEAQAVEVGMKPKQAVRSSTFWRIALAFAYHMMVVGAVITHVMPYLSTIGLTRSSSSLVATGIPLMSIGGRLGFGWLGDRLDRRLVAAIAFAMMGLGVLCFGYAASAGAWLLAPFIGLFAIGYGGSNAMRPSLASEYFDRTNFGTVFGLMVGINTLGGMIGPPLAGWVYDSWGSYQGIWFVFAGLAIAALASVLTIPRSRTKVERGR